jgi:2-hydroxychromene-2-carboxylate isomerase
MDCRREANRRGLSLHGPRKIFDSTIAHIGFLFAKASGDFRAYHDEVYARFWRRELDIEDVAAIEAVLIGADIGCAGFRAYLAGPGRELLNTIQSSAEAAGVFGVPSYLANGELFWGSERFARAQAHALGCE